MAERAQLMWVTVKGKEKFTCVHLKVILFYSMYTTSQVSH